MKSQESPPLLSRAAAWSAVLSTLLLVGCNEPSGAAPATNTTAAPAAGAQGPVIAGEHFTVRQIIDHQQGELPVCVFIAPQKWQDKSQVSWNYGHHSNPVAISASVENPANDEAFFAFLVLQFFCLRPQGNFYQPGQDVGGLIHAEPMPPAETLLAFIRRARGAYPKWQLVGSRDLPDLAKAVRVPPSENQRGVGVKITYELNGKPVEEEFYAVYYSVNIPYDGPQGRIWQNNWGLNAVHSFRAPAGKLEPRKPVFAAMAKSFRPNPAWQQRLAAVNSYLAAQFNQQLQAGYDSIAAAGRLSRQISANNDAMIASIDRQLQSARTSSGGSAAARSANDKFSDYIRGVETVDDPYYGTSQHSSTEKDHWTDGYGNYRHSNDATYNPNQHEQGDWKLMTPTR